MPRAAITDLFGIELPVIQAPMAGSQGSSLAIAVSEAGGLGSLPCAMLAPAAVREELKKMTWATSKPYNVNFFVHRQPEPEPEREAEWRKILAPYYVELGIEPSVLTPGPARLPFNAEVADVLEEFKPPVVSFHFGLPLRDLVTRVKSWGSKIISSATTVDEARYLEANGVDAVIAQGFEAGGHRGMFLTSDLNTQLGTVPLVRQIVKAVKIPVIAAGGIADKESFAAAMALGAAGVQVGTAYLCCPEATTSAVHRQALQSTDASTTAITNIFTGRPARGIMNRIMREIGPLNAWSPTFPLAAAAMHPLRQKAESIGRNDFSSLWAGQNARLCKEVPAGRLTRDLASTERLTP
ncbi:MAG TPA: nitronate monooxygenase [Vicinamibacterales bacterium]|nr:nitronate monooxygenase [Vicinamibacterales bacterium]